MKTSNLRKTLIAAAIAAATGLGGAAVLAQAPQGPAPMQGQGMGPGMAQGQGMGMGPGMMGPGMMGGGMMGQGMMGGMMGGYGMGPGMMQGQGMGMGPGMMEGGMMMGPLSTLNLSEEQLGKVEKIHDDLRKRNWEIAGRMMDESNRMRDLMRAEKRDRKAISDSYKKLAELRQQRFEARLDAHDKVEAVLTKEQKDQLRRFGGWGSVE